MRAESPAELTATTPTPVESATVCSDTAHARSQPPAATHQEVNLDSEASPTNACGNDAGPAVGDTSICRTQLFTNASEFCSLSRVTEDRAVSSRDEASCSNTASADSNSIAAIITATRTSRRVNPVRAISVRIVRPRCVAIHDRVQQFLM